LSCREDLVRVTATITEHTKLAKVVVFKKKRRKNYKRKKGKWKELELVLTDRFCCCYLFVFFLPQVIDNL